MKTSRSAGRRASHCIFVAKLAAERVKVVLTGEGSDELFGGYARYRFYQLNQRWMNAYRGVPGSVRGGIRDLVSNRPMLSASLRRKLGHTVLGREANIESLYLDNFYCAFDAGEAEAASLRPVTQRIRMRFSCKYWERGQTFADARAACFTPIRRRTWSSC